MSDKTIQDRLRTWAQWADRNGFLGGLTSTCREAADLIDRLTAAPNAERLRWIEELFSSCTADTPVVMAPNDSVLGGKVIVDQKCIDELLVSRRDEREKCAQIADQECTEMVELAEINGKIGELGIMANCDFAALTSQRIAAAIRARNEEM